MGGIKPSCGSWTQARANHESYFHEVWISGFVSGANFARYLDDKIDVLKGVDDAALFAWLDNYCRPKPLDSFSIAATSLVNELRARKGLPSGQIGHE
jgi:hypothetical protein